MRQIFSRNYIALLSLVSIAIVLGSMWYSNQLVSELARKEERLVKFWAATAEHIYTSNAQDVEFLFLNVLVMSDSSTFQVPAIVTDSSGRTPLVTTLQVPDGLSPADSAEYVAHELEAMQQNLDEYPPIRIDMSGGNYQWLYYRESDEVRKLRYFPYVTVTVVVLFLGLVFLNFYIAQRSQLNKVWVGLAKETAHQLGTPLSALMAWTEILRMNAQNEEDEEIAAELEKDIRQLEVIAERFSKIGSDPDLVLAPVSASLAKSVDYYRKRASSKVTIQLSDQLPHGLQARLSPTLFEWVIENLLKNALDAGAKQIEVSAEVRQDHIGIEVRDNGKGIPASKLKRVFKPGYTTKKRGWGLGLSLAKRIIESYHQGRIYVKSSEVGVGTTFRISLPLQD